MTVGEELASQEETEQFRKEIDDNIDRLEAEGHHNRRRAFNLQMTIAILAASTTVLACVGGSKILNQAGSAYISVMIAIVSAIISVISARDSFYNHKEMWVFYSLRVQRLYSLKRELDHLLSTKRLTGSKLDELFAKLQKVLAEGDKIWVSKRGRK